MAAWMPSFEVLGAVASSGCVANWGQDAGQLVSQGHMLHFTTDCVIGHGLSRMGCRDRLVEALSEEASSH